VLSSIASIAPVIVVEPFATFRIMYSYVSFGESSGKANFLRHPPTACAPLVSRLHTTAASTSRLTQHAVLYSLSPDDGHNDARNMLSYPIVNKHLYLCHSLTTLTHSLITLTEVFPCFSSVVRQMPGLNSQSRGTELISSELLSFVLCLSLCYAIVFMLFCCYYVVLLLCCSVIICVVLCIDCVYCTTATGC